MIKLSKDNVVSGWRYCLLACLLSAGCAGIFRETATVDETSSRAKGETIENTASSVTIEENIKNEKADNKEPEYGIEITWDMPEEPVDGYILYSSESKGNFDSELHLRIKDLKVTEQGQYSYIIAPVDPDKPIFIAIAAKKGESISEKSEVQEFTAKPKFQ